ncbi:MAG: leucine-rich repeat domain-containing protein [Myxococcales bacterium]|nr:leucine-rich repeat domain-containing protein [Myxococcales bacterium]
MQVVDLDHGPLDPAALADADALEVNASGVDIDALAAALAALRDARGLKSLHLRSRVRALPPAIAELRGLQHLTIVDPLLPGLPSAIAELTRLRSLHLDTFSLTSLPRSIAKLNRLRALSIESHHLCGLPEGLRALTELRELTLILHHHYVQDWERPAHFNPHFTQPLEELFAILADLPALASLTLGEPHSTGSPAPIFGRLPEVFGELRALETLAFVDKWRQIALPGNVVMPSVRRVERAQARFGASEDELRRVFPNATFSVRHPGDVGR